MPTSSPDQIQVVFERLGLADEEQRQRFRDMASPIRLCADIYCPIRLDIVSSPLPVEDEDAKLAPVARRDQGQG